MVFVVINDYDLLRPGFGLNQAGPEPFSLADAVLVMMISPQWIEVCLQVFADY